MVVQRKCNPVWYYAAVLHVSGLPGLRGTNEEIRQQFLKAADGLEDTLPEVKDSKAFEKILSELSGVYLQRIEDGLGGQSFRTLDMGVASYIQISLKDGDPMIDNLTFIGARLADIVR